MNSYLFYEYQEPVDSKGNPAKIDDIFPDKQNVAQSFENYLKNNGLSDVFDIKQTTISAKNYVGVVKFKKYQFNILPKLLKNKNENAKENFTIIKNLFFILSYISHLDIKDSDIALMSKSQNPFLEIYINLYAKTLFNALKLQFPRNYENFTENLMFLRGRLDIQNHIVANCTNKARFYCIFDEFSEDNWLLQTFKFVSQALFYLTESSENKKYLKQILIFLQDVSYKNISFDYYKRHTLNRNQKAFDIPWSLAGLFLEKASLDISSRKIKSIAIVFDMNRLFEEFIFSIINKNQSKFNSISSRPIYQKNQKLISSSRKLTSGEIYSTNLKDTYSDIVLDLHNDKRLIIDTKYKLNRGERSDFVNHDIYQVLAYKDINKIPEITKSIEGLILYPEYTNKFFWLHNIGHIEDKNVFLSSVNLNIDIRNDLLFSNSKIIQELNTIFNTIANN